MEYNASRLFDENHPNQAIVNKQAQMAITNYKRIAICFDYLERETQIFALLTFN